jgi:DNA-binding response OmpR family regulator
MPEQQFRMSIAPRVLVLSPDRAIGAVVARYLGKNGFTASFTVNTVTARDQTQRGAVDLLLVDLPEETSELFL